MGDNNAEIIGGVAVTVEADLSDLQSGFDTAVATATQAGHNISSALSAASNASDTDALTQSLQNVGNAAETAGTQMAALADEPQTLAQYYDQLEAAALGASSSTEQVGQSASEAAGNLAEASSSTSDLGASSEALSAAVTALSDNVAALSQHIDELAEHLKDTKEPAENLKSGLAGIVAGLSELGEALIVTEGLKEFAGEALSVYGNVQKATISIAALSGSANYAKESIEGLKTLALSNALAFPDVVAASQRMHAFGIEADRIPRLLQDAANSAGATGNAFESVAQRIVSVSASGMASGRILASLGLTVENLADVMDVASGEVSKVFKSLDESERVERLDAALQKFKGVSEAVAQSIPGEWQNVKTQFEFVMEGIGEAIAPAASDIMKFLTDTVIPAVKGIVDAFESLPEPIRNFSVVVVGLLGVAGPATLAIVGFIKTFQGLSAITTALSAIKLAVAGTGVVAGETAAATGVLSGALGVLGTVALPAVLAALPIVALATLAVKTADELATGATVSWKDALLSFIGVESEAEVRAKAIAGTVHNAGDAAKNTAENVLNHLVPGYQAAGAAAGQLTQFHDGLAASADKVDAALARIAERTANFRLRVAELPPPLGLVSEALDMIRTDTGMASVEAKGHEAVLAAEGAEVLRLREKLAELEIELKNGTASIQQVAKASEELDAKLKAINATPTIKLQIDPAPILQADEAVNSFFGLLKQAPAFVPTLEQIDEEWAKTSRSVNRLAKYDLPAAIQAYQTHIDQLKQVGAANGEIYASQEKLLQIQIDYRSEFGADATAQIVALTNLKEKTEALQTASQNLGQVYAGFVHAFDNAFTELGSQLTEATIHSESFGQAFHNVVKKIESDIVGTLINGALKELKAAIVNLLSGSGSSGGILGSLGGILGGSGNKSSSELTAAASSMQSATTKFNADITRFDGSGTNFRQSTDAFKSTNDIFKSSVDSMQSAVNQFQQAVQTDSESTSSFGTSTGGFDDSAGLFDDSSSSFDSSAGLFDSSASSFGSDVNSFGGLVGQMSSLFGGGGGAGGIIGDIFSIFSMKGGGEVGDVPILSYLHPKEMVLPADLTAGIKNIIASGSTNVGGLGNATININSGTLPNLSGFADAVNGFTDAIASSSRSETPASPVSTTPSVSVSVPQAPSPRIAVPSIQAPEASAPKSPAPTSEPEPAISSVTASAFRTSVGDFAEIASSLGKLPVAVTNFKTTTDSFTDRLSDFGSKMGKSGATSTAESGTPFSSPGLSGAVGLRLYAFEGGGDVPGNVLALLHAQEMVLPAPLAQGLRNLFAQGGLGGEMPSLNLSLPSVPSSASSFALPSTGESSVSGGSERAVFENCTFTGVTPQMVNDLMNKVVQATRRAGSRF